MAVVIPEKKELQSFAKQQGISGDYKDLLKNDKASLKPCCCACLLVILPAASPLSSAVVFKH